MSRDFERERMKREREYQQRREAAYAERLAARQARREARNRGAWGERFEDEGDKFDPSDESVPESEL